MFSRRRIVYIEGQRLSGNVSKPLSRFLRKTKIKETHHQQSLREIIQTVADNNPEVVVFNGHGNQDGKVLICSTPRDVSYHPSCIEPDAIAARKKTEKSKLRLVEVYGCSIGAGIGEDWLQAIQNAGMGDIEPPQSDAARNMICYTGIGPDVTYILNAGKKRIISDNVSIAASDSLDIGNILNLVLQKILTYPETFKVLKRGISDDKVHAHTFRILKPESVSDLSDENIRYFLMENIERFRSFYSEHYKAGRALSKEEESLFKKYHKQIRKLDINSIRFSFLKTFLARGKTEHARHYLDSYTKEFSDDQTDELMRYAIISDKEDVIRLLFSKAHITDLSHRNIYNCLNWCHPNALNLLLSSTDFIPKIDDFLYHREFYIKQLYGQKKFLKTIAALLCHGGHMPPTFSSPLSVTTGLANHIGYDETIDPTTRSELVKKLFVIIDNDLQHQVFGTYLAEKLDLGIAYQKLKNFVNPVVRKDIAPPATTASDDEEDYNWVYDYNVDDFNDDRTDEAYDSTVPAVYPDELEGLDFPEDISDFDEAEVAAKKPVIAIDDDEDMAATYDPTVKPASDHVPSTTPVLLFPSLTIEDIISSNEKTGINSETLNGFCIRKDRIIVTKNDACAMFTKTADGNFEERSVIPQSHQVLDTVLTRVTTMDLHRHIMSLNCDVFRSPPTVSKLEGTTAKHK